MGAAVPLAWKKCWRPPIKTNLLNSNVKYLKICSCSSPASGETNWRYMVGFLWDWYNDAKINAVMYVRYMHLPRFWYHRGSMEHFSDWAVLVTQTHQYKVSLQGRNCPMVSNPGTYVVGYIFLVSPNLYQLATGHVILMSELHSYFPVHILQGISPWLWYQKQKDNMYGVKKEVTKSYQINFTIQYLTWLLSGSIPIRLYSLEI